MVLSPGRPSGRAALLLMRLKGVPVVVQDLALGVVLFLADLSRSEFQLKYLAPTVPQSACLAVAYLALGWRRRSPVVVFCIVLAPSAVAELSVLVSRHGAANGSGGLDRALRELGMLGTPAVAFYLALYTIAALRGRWVATAALMAVIVLQQVNAYGPWWNVFGTQTTMFVGLFLFGRVLASVHRQIAVREQLRAREAVVEERLRIARELHDIIAHSVSVIVLQATGAQLKLDRGDVRSARAVLGDINGVAKQTMVELRRLLGLLRAASGEEGEASRLEPQPGFGDLEDLLTRIRGTGLDVTVEVEGTPRELDLGVGLAAYRITQEALTNVLKHVGAAARVTVRQVWTTDLLLEITDVHEDSSVRRSAMSTGHGLLGLRERAELVGGSLVAGPLADERGFRVVARLPLQTAAVAPQPTRLFASPLSSAEGWVGSREDSRRSGLRAQRPLAKADGRTSPGSPNARGVWSPAALLMGRVKPLVERFKGLSVVTQDLALAAVLFVVDLSRMSDSYDFTSATVADVIPLLGWLGIAYLALGWRRQAPVIVVCVVLAHSAVVSVAETSSFHSSTSSFYGLDSALRALSWVDTPTMALYVALYTVVSRRGWLVATAVAVVADVVVLMKYGDRLWVSVFEEESGELAGIFLFGRARASVYRQAAVREQLRAREAVVGERLRIARELHDIIAHSVSVIVLQAAGAQLKLDREDVPAARGALGDINDVAKQTMVELRRLLGLLRAASGEEGEAPRLEPQPGFGDLDELVERIRATGLDVTVEVEGEPQDLDLGVGLAAYRITQEALTNILKHVGAGARVTVRQAWTTDLLLEITDVHEESALRPSAMSTGHGLLGLRERAELVGGSLLAAPLADGRGFRVTARLPLKVPLGAHA